MNPKVKFAIKIGTAIATGLITAITKHMEEKELNEKIRKEAVKVVAEMLKKEA